MEAVPDFDLIQNCVFSDISDEDMINASQEVESNNRFLKPLNQQDLDDLIRSGLSKKTEAKSNLDFPDSTHVYMYTTAFGLFSTHVPVHLNYFTELCQFIWIIIFQSMLN